jgi:hypothetical protein
VIGVVVRRDGPSQKASTPPLTTWIEIAYDPVRRLDMTRDRLPDVDFDVPICARHTSASIKCATRYLPILISSWIRTDAAPWDPTLRGKNYWSACMSLTPTENKLLARRYFDQILNDGDFSVAETVLASNCTFRNPPIVADGRERVHDSDSLACGQRFPICTSQFTTRSLRQAGENPNAHVEERQVGTHRDHIAMQLLGEANAIEARQDLFVQQTAVYVVGTPSSLRAQQNDLPRVCSSLSAERGRSTRGIAVALPSMATRRSSATTQPPRSLHRPLAVVDGSLTEKANKTGVRLWTESKPRLT